MSGKKLGLDKQYKNLNVNRNYLQYPVINSVKPKPKPVKMTGGGLSDKQKKIAAAAPPTDKITGADFAALKKMKNA
jgi:hypothetical protein